jgi:predicted Fe-Mo cluster-binding NifX family protein
MLATSSEHFGHCQFFTVVDVAGSKPVKTVIVDNPPHKDCTAPVQLLASMGVRAMIVQGIGLRPLAAFKSTGIEVLASRGKTVGELVAAYITGKLAPMDESSVCSGGSQSCR